MRTPEPRKKKKTATPKKKPSPQIAELKARLQEAEETLEAIRSGAVDAIVVSGKTGDQIFTLQGADRSYRLLVESINEGVVTISSDGVILYCNQQFADMVGMIPEKIIGTPFLAFVAREDRFLFEQFFSSKLQSICRYRVFLKGSDVKDVFVQVSLGYADVAGLSVTTAIISDLTEQFRHLELIKEEKLSRAVIDQSPVGIAVCDKDGRIIRMSPALRMLGKENMQGEIFDENFHLLLSGRNIQAKLFSTESLLSGNVIEQRECILYEENGETRHVIFSGRPFFDEDGQINGCLIALLDITDRKRAEDELQAAHHQLEMATLAAEAGTWDWDVKTGKARWSIDTFDLYGLDPEKDKPSVEKWLSVVHPEDSADAWERLQKAVNGQTYYSSDYRIVKPDGQVCWISSRGKALYDENGHAEKMMGICIDNTKQKRAEERILQQNAVLDGMNRVFQESLTSKTEQELVAACLEVAEDLTDSKLGFIARMDPDGLLRDIMDTAFDREGAPSTDQPGHHRPVFRYELSEIYKERIREGKNFFVNDAGELSKNVRIPEGHPPLHSFLAAPLILEEKPVGLIGLFNRERGYDALQQDILEDVAPAILQAILGKRTELIVNHQADLLSMVSDAVIAFDIQKRITYLNQAAARMYGWAADEALGRTLEELMPSLAGGGKFTRLDDCIERRDVFRDEFVHCRRDGSRFWVEEASSALFDEEGQVCGFVTANRNISDRKKDEKTKEEWTRRLEAANKDLESFSYSVSHDLRAPLRAIDGYSRMIMKRHGTALVPDAMRKFNEIRQSAQKMGQLIDDLLNFSRTGRADLTVRSLDMEALITDVWQEIMEQASRERRIAFTLQRDIPGARGDRAMIRQVIFNFLDNAFKFTSLREEANIEVGGYSSGEEIIYFIRDNGAGFDMEYYDKLFGVFQRLHSADVFPGTGVGLAIVQRILHRHGGRAWAEGEIDKGACFYFSLPGVTS